AGDQAELRVHPQVRSLEGVWIELRASQLSQVAVSDLLDHALAEDDHSQASPRSTKAQRSTWLHDHVGDLAGAPIGTRIQPSVDDQPGADPEGVGLDVEHVGCAYHRSCDSLSEGCQVGVVPDADR